MLLYTFERHALEPKDGAVRTTEGERFRDWGLLLNFVSNLQWQDVYRIKYRESGSLKK